MNIEHQSQINRKSTAKNTKYILQIIEENKEVEQYIVYTGKREVKTFYADKNLYIKSTIIKTRKIDYTVRLNNILYKIENKKYINGYDIIDIIGMPTFNHDLRDEKLIEILVNIAKNIKTSEFLLNILIICIIMWASSVYDDYEKIEKIKGDLLMIGKIDATKMLEIATAFEIQTKIKNLTEINKKKTEEIKTLTKNNEKTIKELLKYETPEEIAKTTNFTVKEILKIKNSK